MIIDVPSPAFTEERVQRAASENDCTVDEIYDFLTSYFLDIDIGPTVVTATFRDVRTAP